MLPRLPWSISNAAATTQGNGQGNGHTKGQGKGIIATVAELATIGEHAAKQNLGARQLSRTFLSGQYASHFRGRGMDYLETRPYAQGDDIRNIDWRVTARTGKTHSKVFIEERDRSIMLLGDFSTSLYFGTRNAFKSVLAARIAAVLAFSGIKRGDRVGCLIKTPQAAFDLRPKGGRRHTMQVLKAFAQATQAPQSPQSPQSTTHFAAQTGQTNPANHGESLLSDLLQQANRSVPTGASVILLSDFYPEIAQFHKPLFQLIQRTDVVGFHLYDPLEKALPLGRIPLSDGANRLRVFTDKSAMARQCAQFEARCAGLTNLFEKLGQTLIHASTAHDIQSLFSAP